MRQGLKLLKDGKFRSYRDTERRLNKCCTIHGKDRPNKNGCRNCLDLKECTYLYDQRCEAKKSKKKNTNDNKN